MATPIVLVHGNPESPAVWDLLAPRLVEHGFDAPIRLSPPGFGAPVPSGFDPTPVAYRDWLVERLVTIGEPVHLVGHDWGGVHVALTAMHRPDLLRSWVTDEAAMLEPDYVWHDLGQMWQRAGDGERWVQERLAMSLPQRAASYAEIGMAAAVATAVAGVFDETMGTTILALYRASDQPVLSHLGRRLPDAAQRPGLAVVATGDPTAGSMEQRKRAAARAGAQLAVLEGSGHWWMTEGNGETAADALVTFWRNVS